MTDSPSEEMFQQWVRLEILILNLLAQGDPKLNLRYMQDTALEGLSCPVRGLKAHLRELQLVQDLV